jgi:transcription elongation factor/antiterminator RfaH
LAFTGTVHPFTGAAGQEEWGQIAAREEGPRWYAVYTRPHRELGASSQLEAQGFLPFVPTCKKTVRHARRFRTVNAAFFPRYLFVKLDLRSDQWRSVNGTFGVSTLVMGGDRPRPVPQGIVEQLRAIADTNGLVGLQPGERVRVLAGPFAEMIGEVLRVSERDRVQILLNLMGASVPVDVRREALATA